MTANTGQRLAAPGAGRRIVVDRGIGGFHAAQRLARMTRLAAGRLAGWLTQATDPWRLLQSVAEGGLPLLRLFSPRRRSSSANRAVSTAFSARNRSLSACKAAITASLFVAAGALSPQGVSSDGAIDTLTRTRP